MVLCMFLSILFQLIATSSLNKGRYLNEIHPVPVQKIYFHLQPIDIKLTHKVGDNSLYTNFDWYNAKLELNWFKLSLIIDLQSTVFHKQMLHKLSCWFQALTLTDGKSKMRNIHPLRLSSTKVIIHLYCVWALLKGNMHHKMIRAERDPNTFQINPPQDIFPSYK